MATAPPETTEGERLSRLEALVESVIREMTDTKADIRDLRPEMRDLRTMMNRNMLIIMFTVVTMWVTIILTILFRT